MRLNHRNKRVSGYSERLLLRVPPALKADLQDAALEHGISMNEEIVRRLMGPQKVYRAGLTRAQWNAMMELEPKPDDPRSDAEIAAQMEHINPGPVATRHCEHENLGTIEDIELLPGSLPF